MSQPDNGAVQEPTQGGVVTQPAPVAAPQNTVGSGNFTLQPQPQPSGRHFTEEDIERARQQEKDKLYPRLDEMTSQLRAIQEERAAEQAERQRLAEEAEAARRAKEESEMDLRALMEKRDLEWQTRFQETEARYAADRAVFDQERRLQEVISYRQARIEQEADYIIPELRGYITGDTPEQVDAAIESAKQQTQSIIENMRAAMEPQPFRVAANPGVPPVGPMEQLPSYETLTPEAIQGLTMDQYKQHREALLRAASQQQRRGR